VSEDMQGRVRTAEQNIMIPGTEQITFVYF